MAATDPASSDVVSSAATRRLHAELRGLQSSKNPQITVRPSDGNFLEWHFVLYGLPSDTPYHHGCYHGKIVFPPMYPNQPPSIIMITPSGRFETHTRLCLSMTDWHPESWNPAWKVETILVGLLSFFLTDEKGYGSLQCSETQRRMFAQQSWSTNAATKEFKDLFPEFGAPQPDQAASSADTEPQSAASVVQDEPPAADQASSGAEAEAPIAVSVAEPEPSVEDMQCWICLQNTQEPLIHPCACRGSMSGVHRSCVEEWIRSRRIHARNDAHPRCSVCHQEYVGSETRPGVCHFVRYTCFESVSRILRWLLLVIVLCCYQAAAGTDKDLHISMTTRVVVIAVFAVVSVHKVVILMVSLPPGQPPPEHRLLRRFYIDDTDPTRRLTKLSLHISEVTTSIAVMAMWTATKALPIAYFLPPATACFLLIAKLCLSRSPTCCCLVKVVAFVLFSPILLLVGLVKLIRNYPRQSFDVLIHPLGPGPHSGVAIAAGTIALACDSNLPLLVLLGVHASFLSAACVERLLVRRVNWKACRFWVLPLQLTVLSCYTCNLCVFPAGIGNGEQSTFIVLGSTSAWLLLILAFTVSINWEACVRVFRTWQNQHGVFTLHSSNELSEAPNEPLQP